jgi:hypothetical protein
MKLLKTQMNRVLARGNLYYCFGSKHRVDQHLVNHSEMLQNIAA